MVGRGGGGGDFGLESESGRSSSHPYPFLLGIRSFRPMVLSPEDVSPDLRVDLPEEKVDSPGPRVDSPGLRVVSPGLIKYWLIKYVLIVIVNKHLWITALPHALPHRHDVVTRVIRNPPPPPPPPHFREIIQPPRSLPPKKYFGQKFNIENLHTMDIYIWENFKYNSSWNWFRSNYI